MDYPKGPSTNVKYAEDSVNYYQILFVRGLGPLWANILISCTWKASSQQVWATLSSVLATMRVRWRLHFGYLTFQVVIGRIIAASAALLSKKRVQSTSVAKTTAGDARLTGAGIM